jgi:hypothetical protein
MVFFKGWVAKSVLIIGNWEWELYQNGTRVMIEIDQSVKYINAN